MDNFGKQQRLLTGDERTELERERAERLAERLPALGEDLDLEG